MDFGEDASRMDCEPNLMRNIITVECPNIMHQNGVSATFDYECFSHISNANCMYSIIWEKILLNWTDTESIFFKWPHSELYFNQKHITEHTVINL